MDNCSGGGQGSSTLIFLGTCCSTGVPRSFVPYTALRPHLHCLLPLLIYLPSSNPNYRCNTSLLIDYCQDNEDRSYILVDVGKTFREQLLRWFTLHHIPRVDSVILTHEHADAVLGLDDIRTVQPFSPTNDTSPIPIYLNQHSMNSIEGKFSYLVKKKLKEGQEIRRVSQVDWRIIESNCEKPFVGSGLQFNLFHY